MHNISKFVLFWNNTVHVSEGLSVHHQESKTVPRASGVCHTSPVAAFPLATSYRTCMTYLMFYVQP